ncbi:hypothetical protein FOZ63_033817 [Perkinsus olseni]|uniref:Uncharacterized protein n=1 Tax=Perkinsus olseni TaxID=32597 RepID=A0A7J6RIC0_PEROL|nr:hypothetical protein FOZ63_033817 [Perkinsus olseni]
MKNSSWLSMFVKVPGIYVPVEDLDDFFTPQETLQDRLTSIERRRTLVRLIHYGEVVLRCSALIGSVLWMWFITDRPTLAVSLVAAAIIRILVTVCLASQSKETHLITIFGRGIEKSTEGHVRLLMKSFDEEEGSPHLSMAAVKEEARDWLMKFYSKGYYYPRHSSVLVPLVVVLVSSVAAVTFTVHGQWLTLGIFPTVYMTTESPVALFGRAGTFMRYAAVWMEVLFIMAAAELLFNICGCLVVGIAAIQARLDGQRYFQRDSRPHSCLRSKSIGSDRYWQICASAVNQVSVEQWRFLRHPLGYLYTLWLVIIVASAAFNSLLASEHLPLGTRHYVDGVATCLWWTFPSTIVTLWLLYTAAQSNGECSNQDQFSIAVFGTVSWPMAILSFSLATYSYGLELYLLYFTAIRTEMALL